MDSAEFSLAQLQGWMQDVVTGNAQHTVPLGDVINSSSRLNAWQHLNIYRSSYIARLRECMRNQFSALSYALGKDLFEAFADQYLNTYPSYSYTLNTLGKQFASFLQDTRPDASEKEKESWPDFMIELAQFEYSLSLIFDEHVHDDEPQIEKDEDNLKLTTVFHLFHHSYPICTYYLDFTQKKEPELPLPQESYCVVLRKNYKLGLFTIYPAQHYFLSCLLKGMTITEAQSSLATQFNTNITNVERLWKEWRVQFIASGFLG